MSIKTFRAAAALALAAAAPAWADSAKDYNLFVLGDYSAQYTDSEGRVAVGGNAALNGYGVGDRLSAAAGTNSLVVGGNLSYGNGQVFQGNVVAGGSIAGNVTVANGTKTANVAAFDFPAEALRLENLSATLAGYAATGTTTYQYGGLSFAGTSAGLNVFRVSGAQLAAANSFTVTAPAGAQLLFNIDGTADQMQNFGFSLGNVVKTAVLYNFYQATSLTLGGISVQGSILAPAAAVAFSNGNVEGTLIAGSLIGSGEMHNALYAGTLLDASAPNATGAVPEPASWAMMITGFGLVGGVLRRRGGQRLPALHRLG